MLLSVDVARGSITMRRSVCALPRGLAYDPVADRLHVACAGGELVTFAPTGATPDRTLKLDQDLRDVVVEGSQKARGFAEETMARVRAAMKLRY
jgi:hypothetical protein